jgi:prepilin-type N-terminal cleavage/methylation domain-containing protein
MYSRLGKQSGFTLVEFLVVTALVLLITVLLTAALREIANKAAEIGLDRRIKIECNDIEGSVGKREINLTVGEITEFGLMDFFGPSLEVRSVKVQIEKRSDGCYYKLVATGTKDGETVTEELKEFSKIPGY